eukprot:4006398-Pyramimonas_sp.AAC.1
MRWLPLLGSRQPPRAGTSRSFFDSVSPSKLIHLASNQGCPGHLLYLGLLVHAAPRLLEVSGRLSRSSAGGGLFLPGVAR